MGRLVDHESPTELGKLLTGQAYDGDAKECMDALATQIDTKVKGRRPALGRGPQESAKAATAAFIFSLYRLVWNS